MCQRNIMKIAIIFPRLSGPYGGEKILIETSNELARRGHKITLYVYEYNKICGDYLDANIRVVKCRAFKFRRHNLDTFLAYLAMPYLAQKIGRDHDLILGMTWQSALALWWLCKIRRFRLIPLVYHCFEPPRFLYDLQTVTGNSALARFAAYFVKRTDRASVRSAGAIVAISDYIQKEVKKIYSRDSFKIYPGVEIARFQKYSREQGRAILSIPVGQEVFLSISKLHKRKRLDEALKVFKDQKKDKNSVFYIGGAGPEENKLRQLVKKMGLEKQVAFIGVVLGEKCAQYMASCDYFIFTALNEPFGIAPLEAKVAGAKVIPADSPYPILSWQESIQEMERLFFKLAKSWKQP